MSKPAPSPVLPLAYISLRILIVLNWLYGAAIVLLLVAMPTRRWIMSALELSPSLEADQIVFGLRLIAVIGVVTIPLNFVILKRLLEIVETVRSGDPFIGANASRLRTIAWTILALQCLSLVIGGIANVISTKAHPISIGAGFSTTGWLAVILTFLLAHVFAQGTAMREDLEGTV